MDAERVRQLLHIDAEQAELLLAEASVSALLEQTAEPRVRVDTAPLPAELEEPALDDAAGEVAVTRKETET
jgi:hypothetical protein